MSWESYFWLLRRACGVTASQIIAIAQPCGNGYPSTEPDFRAATTMRRRIGRIPEHVPYDIVSALCSPLLFGGFVDHANDGAAESAAG